MRVNVVPCSACCRFYFQLIATFLGFPFTTTVWSTFGALPFIFGIRMEAGSETTSIRSNIRDSVNAKLDALKKSGEGAIKEAMDKLTKAQNDVNGICEVREQGFRSHCCSHSLAHPHSHSYSLTHSLALALALD